ncbi:hypothetical protein IQ07DRAFT_500120 [Pyrenochaeta sp. DS3sAY3a]|nr:hypothetical protein IQ07DRAFT_500120 [Pyrenochaeta sp. DS3sAY3a]
MIAPTRSASTLSKPGYQKILKTCEIARTNYQLPWVWIDTCCIDKTSSAELSEAINSMFKWYRDALICFAFLSDMDGTPATFQSSRWFRRGWTLQELLAPKDLVFFDRDWTFRNTKTNLRSTISAITGIQAEILAGSVQLDEVPVAVRFSWASARETTREEDLAYCLLGIFDVNMPMLYGEGQKAFIRLQEAILSQSADMSLFLWNDLITGQKYSGLFAPSPRCFREMGDARAEPVFTQREFYPTNRGVRFKLGLTWETATGLAILPLKHTLGPSGPSCGVYLRRVGLDYYIRDSPQQYCSVKTGRSYAVFTAAKTLTALQSVSVQFNSLRVSLPANVKFLHDEPPGSWNPSESTVHASHNGAFLGYLSLQEEWEFGKQFTLVYCFKGGKWSATVVKEDKWDMIQGRFYRYYKERPKELFEEGDAYEVVLGSVPTTIGTEVFHFSLCGRRGMQNSCINIRVVSMK